MAAVAAVGLAGADLLGSMVQWHPGDVRTALRAWEAQLRPYITRYQEAGLDQRSFFTPESERQIALRPAMAHGVQLPVIGDAVHFLRRNSKVAKARDFDLAHVA